MRRPPSRALGLLCLVALVSVAVVLVGADDVAAFSCYSDDPKACADGWRRWACANGNKEMCRPVVPEGLTWWEVFWRAQPSALFKALVSALPVWFTGLTMASPSVRGLLSSHARVTRAASVFMLWLGWSLLTLTTSAALFRLGGDGALVVMSATPLLILWTGVWRAEQPEARSTGAQVVAGTLAAALGLGVVLSQPVPYYGYEVFDGAFRAGACAGLLMGLGGTVGAQILTVRRIHAHQDTNARWRARLDRLRDAL